MKIINAKKLLLIFVFSCISVSAIQAQFTAVEFKEAHKELIKNIKNKNLNLDEENETFRSIEMAYKMSITDYEFMKGTKVFQNYFQSGFNPREYRDVYTIVMGVVQAPKDNDELLVEIKKSFDDVKSILDDCDCKPYDDISEYQKFDKKNNFSAFWNCNNRGNLELNVNYDLNLQMYFYMAKFKYPKK